MTSVIMEENSMANLGKPVEHMEITKELREEAEEMYKESCKKFVKEDML